MAALIVDKLIDEEGWTWELHPSHYYIFRKNVQTGLQIQEGYIITADAADGFIKKGFPTFVTPNTNINSLQKYSRDNPMPIVQSGLTCIPNSGATYGVLCFRQDAPPVFPSDENLPKNQQTGFYDSSQSQAPGTSGYTDSKQMGHVYSGYTQGTSVTELNPPPGITPAPRFGAPRSSNQNTKNRPPKSASKHVAKSPQLITKPPVWNERFKGAQTQTTGPRKFDPAEYPALPSAVPVNQWLRSNTSSQTIQIQQTYSTIASAAKPEKPSVGSRTTSKPVKTGQSPAKADNLDLKTVFQKDDCASKQTSMKQVDKSERMIEIGHDVKIQEMGSKDERVTDDSKKTGNASAQSLKPTADTKTTSKASEVGTAKNEFATKQTSTTSVKSTVKTALEASEDSSKGESMGRVEGNQTSNTYQLTSSVSTKENVSNEQSETGSEQSLGLEPTQSSSSTSSISVYTSSDRPPLTVTTTVVSKEQLTTPIFDDTMKKYEESKDSYGQVKPLRPETFPTKSNAQKRREKEKVAQQMKKLEDEHVFQHFEEVVELERKIENEKAQFSISMQYYVENYGAHRAVYLANRAAGYGAIEGLQKTIVDFLSDKCAYTARKLVMRDKSMLQYVSWRAKDFAKKKDWMFATLWEELQSRRNTSMIVQQDIMWLHSLQDTSDIKEAMFSLYQFILFCPQNPPGDALGFTDESFESLLMPDDSKVFLSDYLTRSLVGRLGDSYPEQFDRLPSKFEISITKDFYDNKYNDEWDRKDCENFIKYWANEFEKKNLPGPKNALLILLQLDSDIIYYDMSKLNEVEEKTTDIDQLEAVFLHYLTNVFGVEMLLLEDYNKQKSSEQAGSSDGSNTTTTRREESQGGKRGEKK